MPGQEVPTTQRAWKPVLIRDREIVPPRPPDSEGEGTRVQGSEKRTVSGAAPAQQSGQSSGAGGGGSGHSAVSVLGTRKHGRPWPQWVQAHSGSLSLASSGRGAVMVTTCLFLSGPPPSPTWQTKPGWAWAQTVRKLLPGSEQEAVVLHWGTGNCYLTNRGACTVQLPPLKDPNGDRGKCNSLSPTCHKSPRLPTPAES